MLQHKAQCCKALKLTGIRCNTLELLELCKAAHYGKVLTQVEILWYVHNLKDHIAGSNMTPRLALIELLWTDSWHTACNNVMKSISGRRILTIYKNMNLYMLHDGVLPLLAIDFLCVSGMSHQCQTLSLLLFRLAFKLESGRLSIFSFFFIHVPSIFFKEHVASNKIKWLGK